jgi:hypothetical protein
LTIIYAQDYLEYNSLNLKKSDQTRIIELYRSDSLLCYISHFDRTFELEIQPVPSEFHCRSKLLGLSNKYIVIGGRKILVITFIDEEFIVFSKCTDNIYLHSRNSKSTIIKTKDPISSPFKYEIHFPKFE